MILSTIKQITTFQEHYLMMLNWSTCFMEVFDPKYRNPKDTVLWPPLYIHTHMNDLTCVRYSNSYSYVPVSNDIQWSSPTSCRRYDTVPNTNLQNRNVKSKRRKSQKKEFYHSIWLYTFACCLLQIRHEFFKIWRNLSDWRVIWGNTQITLWTSFNNLKTYAHRVSIGSSI